MRTQEQIEALQAEFNSLQKLSDKFGFWQRKLKIEYHQYLDKVQEYDWLNHFIITPKTPQETEDVNQYLIDFISEKTPNALLNIDSLTNDFNSRLNSVENKAKFIMQELEHVKSKAKKPIPKIGLKAFSTSIENFNSYYCQSYENYLLNNKGLDLKEKVYHPSILIKELNGQTWAEYELYLTEVLNPSKDKEVKKYTHIERMLILDYLGIGKDLNNTKRALLFEAITGKDKETTRQNFSELEKSKKKANLKRIMSLFEEIGFKTQAKQVEKEMIKYQNKK